MKTKLLRTFVALMLTMLATVTAWAVGYPPTISNKTIAVTKVEMQSISIKWEKATDDLTPQNKLKYTIQFRESDTGEYRTVTTLTDVYSYTIKSAKFGRANYDSALMPGKSYDIRIYVTGLQGDHSFYDDITVTTLEDKIPPTIKSKQVELLRRSERSVMFAFHRRRGNEDEENALDNIKHPDGDYIEAHNFKCYYKKENSNTLLESHDCKISYDWYTYYATVDNLEPDTKYEFHPRAYDYSGNYAEYNTLTATTLSKSNPPTLTDPFVRTNNVTSNSISLSWVPATDDVTSQENLFYVVEYRKVGDTTTESLWPVFTNPWFTNEFPHRPEEGFNRNHAKIGALYPNTKYEIHVYVYDRGDNCTQYDVKTVKTLPLYVDMDKSAPEISNKKLTVTNATDNSLTLNWTKAKDNLFDDEDLDYTVMYKEPSSARYSKDGAEQGKNISSSYISSLQPNTTYEFYVRVKDGAGNTSTYDILTYTTSNTQDRTAPTISNKTVTATGATYGSVTLNWNKATDNVTKQENLQYSVYRDGVLCKKMKNETSYIVGDLKPSTKYTFEVRVEDEAGNISRYNTVQATTTAKPVTVVKYPLYIGGEQMTSANAKDFYGDGGTIQYDPTTKTLKLNWAELNYLKIDDDITINLVGWNNIYGNVNANSSRKVTIKADDNNGENAQLKIHALFYGNCDLAIKNECTVEIDGGLDLDGHKLSIYGSTLKMKGDGKKATVVGITELYLQDCRITSGHKYDASNKSFLNASGSIAKDDIVISTEIIRVPVLVNDEIEVEDVTEDGALLSWIGATDDNTPQSDLVYTLYTMRRYGDTDYSYYKDGRNLTSCKLYNLKSNTEYYAKVRVEDKDGNLTFYKETLFKTLPEGDKTAPKLSNSTINVTDLTHSSATLSWAKATDDRTAQDKLIYIAGYKKSSEPESTLQFNVYNAIAYGQDMTSCTVENLEPATSYDFYVVVYDDASNGAAYTKKTVVTKELPDETAPTLGEMMISVDDVTEKSITMSWSPATDDRTPQDKLIYTIESKKAGESVWNANYAGNANSYTIEGLTKATEYDIRISVADEAGNVTSYGEFTVATLSGQTAIDNATVDKEADDVMYTTAGVRVEKNYRGIVIKNGKKVMVKK